jgi:O-antigen/teichoic acid export membrane protein
MVELSAEDDAEPVSAAASLDDRPALESLGSKMRVGLSWKAASQLTSFVGRTAMTVTLAHLLTPHEFGIAGMVLVFSGLILLLTDVGFSASIVQLKSLTESDRSTAFWTGMAICVLFFAISVAVSPFVAAFYDEPQVRWMFVVVATSFITGGLVTTQASLLWRRMDFKALEIRGILATWTSAAAAVVAASLGAGAWSLIVQSVTYSLVSSALIWVLSPWRPQMIYSGASLRRLGSFSLNVFFTRLLGYGDRNLDNILVGRFLGAASLGVYSLGYSVILIPFDRLIWPIQNVVTPAFAGLQDNLTRLTALWIRALRAIMAIMLPAMAGVIIVADDLVHALLGQKWAAVTPIVQILAWVALVQSPAVMNGPIYQSRNRSGLLLRIAIFAFVADATSFAVGLHWGVKGVATAYALGNTVLIVPMSLFFAIRLLEVTIIDLLRSLRGVLEAAFLMALTSYLLREGLRHAGVAPGLRLLAVSLAGAATYVLACRWRAPQVFREAMPARLRAEAR